HDAGLHLAGMIVTVLKELRLIHGVKPVTRAEKHFWIVQSKLADHSLEIVSTVAVQDDQLMYALSVQHLDDVVQHLRLSRWVHVDIKQNIRLSGVDAKRDRGQDNDLRALFPRNTRCLSSHPLCLYDVSSVRKMIVVCFTRAPGQNGNIKFLVANGLAVALSKNVWPHAVKLTGSRT